MPWFHQRPNLLTMYGSLTPPPFQRRFTPLAAAGTQHYTIPTWTASGDFDISVDVYLPDYTNQALLGSTSSNETLRIVDSDTIIYRDATGLSLLNLDTPLPVSQLITLTVTRVGQVISVSSSSGQSGSKDLGRAEDSITFTAIASNNGFNFPTGYLANASLQTAGDNRLYRLDENFGETSVAVDSIGGNNGQAINIAESQLFTEVADGWEGVDVAVSPSVTWDGTQGDFAGHIVTPSLDVNAVYRSVTTASTGATGAYQLSGEVLNTGRINIIDGAHTETSTGGDSFLNLQSWASPSRAVGTLTASVKQFLEVA